MLDITKDNFIASIEELRKESYMLFPSFSDGGKHKQYSLRLYSNFFILESLYKFITSVNPFPLFMTRIYGRYKTNETKLTLTYYITFDITGCLFFIGALFCLIYFSYTIVKEGHFNYTDLIAVFGPYALFVYGFNDESYGDKKFIERLIKANTKSEPSESDNSNK